MEYNFNDTLYLIYNKFSWDVYLTKYWKDDSIIIMNAQAISENYHKRHKFSKYMFSVERLNAWLDDFNHECKRISKSQGDNPVARGTVLNKLLEIYALNYQLSIYHYRRPHNEELEKVLDEQLNAPLEKE